jgi:hypothetical protein
MRSKDKGVGTKSHANRVAPQSFISSQDRNQPLEHPCRPRFNHRLEIADSFGAPSSGMVSQSPSQFCHSEYKTDAPKMPWSRLQGDNHEDRSDWRYWTHWIKARQ